ncbi:MAG TPA: hypothetical protein VFE50_02120 [Cyclobacteriaceae bacterium]|nr:hypothetical protein [Cyclobacteriaceae bacterium]
MNRFFLSLFILIGGPAVAQTIPHDSLILKSIYVHINTDKRSADYKYEDEIYTFSVVYKELWKVSEKETLLVVVTRAPLHNLHGHFWNLNTICYLKESSKLWKTILMKTEEDYLEGEYRLMQIGAGKMALLGDCSSTGNHHFERSLRIKELTSKGAASIGFVGLDYSNEAFISNEFKENEPCPINDVRSNYEFVKSGKEYFDLVLTQEEAKYTEGCKSHTPTSKKLVYTHDGTRYELVK